MRKIILALAILFCTPLAANAACGTGTGTCFVVPAGGAWVSGTFSATTGGASCACVPAAGDALILDSAAGNLTSVVGNPSLASLDASGTGGSGSPYTGTFTHTSGQTITISGNLFKLVAGMTYTLGSATTSALSFTSTSGTTLITTAGKNIGNVTFNGAAGTFQPQDDITQGNVGAVVTLTNGTLDGSLNHNITMGSFSSSNANTRGWTMGNGTATVIGNSGTIYNISGGGSFTLTKNSSTLVFSGVGANNRSINFGVSTSYNVVTFNAATSGGSISFSASATTPTIATLNVAGPNIINDAITTLTVTNLNITGTSAALVSLNGAAAGTGGAVAITAGTISSPAYLTLNNITFNGAAALTSTTCYDLKGNNFNGGSCTTSGIGGGTGGFIINGANDNDLPFKKAS